MLCLEAGQRVRVRGVHRLRGRVLTTSEDRRAGEVLFDRDADDPPFVETGDGPALYLAEELEPDTPCACVWCMRTH